MPEQPYLQLVNVTKIFGKNIILEDINLNIPYGSIFGLIGRSGCGKTTLLRILIGFLKSEKGDVLFQASNLKKNKRNLIRQFGFSTQEGSLYSKLTVRENLFYFGSQYGMSKKELKSRIPEILKIVELTGFEDKLASQISSGMRRRLDIACATVHNPKILILDEPTQDLEYQLRNEIFSLLKKINKEKNVTIILTSHLLREIEPVCTRIAILHNRRIQKVGSIDVLREEFSKNTEIHIESFPGKYDSMKKSLNMHNLKADDKRSELVVFTSNIESALPKVMRMLKVKKEKLIELTVTKPTLEEIFEEITKIELSEPPKLVKGGKTK